jgi:hypothetical protein
MGDPVNKKQKPPAQVAPKAAMVKDSVPGNGDRPPWINPFWSSLTIAPMEKIGPPPPNATVESPYNHGALPALSVEEQFNFLINQMGFNNSPSGAPMQDPKGVGEGVGPARAPGFHVYAAIQVIDPAGKQVYVGYGAYVGGGGAHGEERAINGLRAFLPKGLNLKGGRLIVTVTQCPCGAGRHDCAGNIEAFAREYGLTAEVYVTVRDAVNPNAKKEVSPSTAARGAQRTDRPAIRFQNITSKGGVAPATTPAAASGSNGTRAEVGSPDMSGLNVGGPSAAGLNKINNIVATLYAANFILNTVNDHLQKQAFQQALDQVVRETRAHRAEFPDEGMLLIIFSSQVIALTDSIFVPGPRFASVDYQFGKTQEEAVKAWNSIKMFRQGYEKGVRVITQYAWVPPANG